MPIRSLAHVCIKSTDLNATLKFYCDDLGLKRQFNFMRKGKLIGFYMKAANETFVEAFLADELEKVGKQPLNHFCLETDDIQALRKSLVERGHAPGEIKMGADNAWQFWIKDPSGLDMEFHQYLDNCSQFTGQDVEVNW
jgi:catechol 2,3-dioxygenase-like lactoylglutathione lyase family enzyme